MIKRCNFFFSFLVEDFDEFVDFFGVFDLFYFDVFFCYVVVFDVSGQVEGDDIVDEVCFLLELDLINYFLIVMLFMLDLIFGGIVVYFCEYNYNGVLGVVINKFIDMIMDVLFDCINFKLEIWFDIFDVMFELYCCLVMFGGLVQVECGFVLYLILEKYFLILQVIDEVVLMIFKDVFEVVVYGDGFECVLVILGCLGWSLGQLEGEIGCNGWLIVKVDLVIIFELLVE